MAIGVSYDDFWHGEPELVGWVIEAEELRQKNVAIHDDFVSWNTGRYVMIAVGTVLSQAFSKNSTAKYPNEPVLATELDDRLAELKRERELKRMQADFLAVAAAIAPKPPTGENAT